MMLEKDSCYETPIQNAVVYNYTTAPVSTEVFKAVEKHFFLSREQTLSQLPGRPLHCENDDQIIFSLVLQTDKLHVLMYGKYGRCGSITVPCFASSC